MLRSMTAFEREGDDGSRPIAFQGRLVIRELTLDIAYNHTKFNDFSFSNSRDI